MAVKIEGKYLISCYAPPRLDVSEFLNLLDELKDVVCVLGSNKLIIGGDFNARSPTWDPGCRDDRKGRLIEEWAA